MKIGGTEEVIEGHRGKCKVMKGHKNIIFAFACHFSQSRTLEPEVICRTTCHVRRQIVA
jgi:hypothetical protein